MNLSGVSHITLLMSVLLELVATICSFSSKHMVPHDIGIKCPNLGYRSLRTLSSPLELGSLTVYKHITLPLSTASFRLQHSSASSKFSFSIFSHSESTRKGFNFFRVNFGALREKDCRVEIGGGGVAQLYRQNLGAPFFFVGPQKYDIFKQISTSANRFCLI